MKSETSKKLALLTAVGIGAIALTQYFAPKATRKLMYGKAEAPTFYVDEKASILKRVYGNPQGENSAIVVGATIEMLSVYINLIRQGFILFMIGTPDVYEAVKAKIKETITQIEGMEYPEEESMTVANQELDRIHFWAMEEADWQDEDKLGVLSDIVEQMVNPCVIFINHAAYSYSEQEGVENSPATLVTNMLGKRLLGDLEI